MKNIILFLFIICFTNIHAQVVHKDPYDIKKTNISAFLFLRIGTGGGALMRISHYVNPRFRLLYNGFYCVSGDTKYKGFTSGNWGPAKRAYRPMLHEFEADIHILDFEKSKNVNVAMAWDAIEPGTTRLTYTSTKSTVRRIFCFSLGSQFYFDRELIYKTGGIYDSIRMLDLNTQKEVAIHSATVMTNTRYANISIGFKFKSISATGFKSSEYGKSWQDMHLETYFSLLIPAANGYSRDMYTNFSQKATHQLGEYKPKTGFKMGIFHRNSVRNFWSLGAEFGVQPHIRPKYWQGAYFNLCMGFSLNFGELKYIE